MAMINLKLVRLHAILSALAPIEGVFCPAESSAEARIDFMDAATAQQRTDAQNALAAFDWSDAAETTWHAQRTKLAAAASIDHGATVAADQRERIERCIVSIICEEFNRHSDLELALFNAVNDATGATAAAVWADYKARVAAIPRVPQRSLADLVAAIKTALAATPE